MTSPQPIRLKGQETLTASTVGGKTGVLMGIVFTVLGGFVVGIGLRVIPVDPKSVHAPYWVIAVCGAMFGLPGLFLLLTGVRGVVAERRRRAELLRRPDEPWHADRDWDERGASFSGVGRFVKSFLAAVFIFVFLLPFHWWAFLSGKGPFLVRLFVCLFDIIVLLAAFEALRRFLAMLRYRRSEVLYESFPFFVGEELAIRFVRPAHSTFLKLTFRLQCVEERLLTTGTGKNRSTRHVPFALWEEEVEISEEGGAADAYGELPLTFALPADRPGNRLGKSPPTYWQLLVTGEAAGPDYEGRFLLPVYERPRAG